MMSHDTPVPGQRWVSDSEPELGLGIVLKCEYGRAEIYFPAAGEHRQYALGSAPIRRVRFQEGDTIKTHQGESQCVLSISESNGLLTYQCAGGPVTEAELSDLISFSKPEERLLVGQVDELAQFDLRVECLSRRRSLRQSPIRGFAGARVDLIPHQISIAAEVATRMVPRVLLADEVGLGKTIEAGLILQRLHLTGRAERVLVLLPPALLNQWFVEMFRRFQMSFSIFDEERCASLDAGGENPFLDSQLVICGIDFLSSNPQRAAQAREAGWDLLVVDEAHHLGEADVLRRPGERVAAVLPLLAADVPRALQGEEDLLEELRGNALRGRDGLHREQALVLVTREVDQREERREIALLRCIDRLLRKIVTGQVERIDRIHTGHDQFCG